MNSPNQKKLEEQLEAIKKGSNKDNNYNAIKGGIGLIPGIGSGLQAFYETYVSSPANKRIYDFLESLYQEIQKLQEKANNFNIESSSFKTTLAHALQIASRNHQEEKLNALQNAVLNSALPKYSEENLQLIFLNLIDYFTPCHLSLLNIIYTPNQAEDEEINYTELELEEPFIKLLIKDLEVRGLITLNNHNRSSRSLSREAQKKAEVDYIVKKGDVSSAIKTINEKDEAEDIHSITRKILLRKPISITNKVGKQFLEFIQPPKISN